MPKHNFKSKSDKMSEQNRPSLNIWHLVKSTNVEAQACRPCALCLSHVWSALLRCIYNEIMQTAFCLIYVSLKWYFWLIKLTVETKVMKDKYIFKSAKEWCSQGNPPSHMILSTCIFSSQVFSPLDFFLTKGQLQNR